MSPKPKQNSSLNLGEQSTMSSMQQRRRRSNGERAEQQPSAEAQLAAEVQRAAAEQRAAADGQPAAAEQRQAADDAAVAAAVEASEPPTRSVEDGSLQIIGQELVPASNVAVPVTSPRSVKETEVNPKVTPNRRKEGSMDGFQTPQPSTGLNNIQSIPNSNGNQIEDVKDGKGQGNTPLTPAGMPMILGPPVPGITTSSMVPVHENTPLFTPEQIQRAEELERQAPMLQQIRQGVHPALDFQDPRFQGQGRPSVVPPGHYSLPFPGFDPGVQELHDLRQQQELLWKAQMQQSVEHLMLQLRASRSENLRLKEELQAVMDGRDHSSYATPEGKGSQEDGPAGQQGKKGGAGKAFQDAVNVNQRRQVIQDAQEQMLRSLICTKEDGAQAQQGSLPKEDGAPARQVNLPKEDGSDDRQDSEEEESEDSSDSQEDGSDDQQDKDGPRGQQEGQGKSRKRRSSSKADTLQVVLQLMQGMQAMQQKMMKKEWKKGRKEDDEAEEETVRTHFDLHALPEWNSESAPVDFSDWLLLVTAQMGDLSSSSGTWWELTIATAREWYKRHQVLKPLEKLRHQVKPPTELQAQKWRRLEKRASTLLLRAIPDSQKEDLVAAKDLSVLGIICRLMLNYQPGGGQEKQAVLSAIESPSEASTIAEGITGLRKWLRWKRRAEEVGVTLPDSSVLLRGLDRLMSKVLQGNSSLSFRINLARTTLMVDAVPSESGVEQLAECMLAELDQLSYSKRKGTSSSANQPPKLKKVEETSKGGDERRGKGRPNPEVEGRKQPCKFFLSDQGCRKARDCPYGHVLDEEKRCWTCGSREHFAGKCPRDETKPKAAKATTKNQEKEKPSPGSKEDRKSEAGEDGEGPVEDTMKLLLDEANRMLKNMESSEATEKRSKISSKESGVGDLQRNLQKQLETLKASMKPFRLSRMGGEGCKGLLDSGATHPLRPRKKNEKVSHLPTVRVTLAGDKEMDMRLTETGVILGSQSAEPIVPMGMVTTVLGCHLSWSNQGLEIQHPKRGTLPVRVEDGCPMVSKELAMQLIEEIEAKASVRLRSMKMEDSQEVKWLAQVVEEHPAFRGMPVHVKRALLEVPASSIIPLANRRVRKIWKKKGVTVHLFSGADEGYTLRRALHEVGGDKRQLLELDLLHGKKEADLGLEGTAYPLLLRLALEGKVKAWIGGPPCRTRSVLRHQEIEGKDLPRPLRAWNGQEFGLDQLTTFERNQVETDDILMARFWMLYIVSEMVRKAKDDKDQVEMLMEQPAIPKKEEVVSIWRTKQWEEMERIHNFRRQTFNQSEFGALATKPTTIAGTLRLMVPMKGRKGEVRSVEGKSEVQICEESRKLSRWPPMMMRAIALQILETVQKGVVRMRALSWNEHVAAGHTPFRKDCKVCQQASAKDMPHRRSPLPARVGVLSIDMSGPYHRAPDVHKGKHAKTLLVGCFTWFAPDQEGEDVQDGAPEEEAPDDAPELEDLEAEEEEKKKAEEEAEGVKKRGRPRKKEPELEIQPPPRPLDLPPIEEDQVEPRQDVKIAVYRMCTPLPGRNNQEVLRAIIDMYLRLKADGFTVTQLHSDMGGEFMTQALDDWCKSRCILKTTTPGDAPQTNGRAEVSVQHVKSAIKRILHGAGVGTERWPMAARFFNEKERLRQLGKPDKSPPFLQEVLVRKRYWRVKELGPTQEKVRYIAPSWVHHGHWVERENGETMLVRMVMKSLTEPIEDRHWIGLEDDMNPIEERRRLRGKVSVHALRKQEEEAESQEEGDEDSPEEEEKRKKRMTEVIQREMFQMMDDPEEAVPPMMDSIARMKELQADEKNPGEVLQTRVVPMQEVRKETDRWKEAIQKELKAMFTEKEALKPISSEEVRRMLREGTAEVIPSKLVCTVKPSPECIQGRCKARLVACGNFSSSEESPSELFAGGATSVALRLTVAISSQRSWGGSILDIKAAFLNAPMTGVLSEGDQTGRKELKPIIKPPPILVAMGLAKEDEYWAAEKAVYGYRKSPRLWSNYRDGEMRKFKINYQEKPYVLQQMITEPDLWKVVEDTSESKGVESGEVCGLVLVYVDDLLIVGPDGLRAEIVKVIQSRWETSNPETIGSDEGSRFLGTEIWHFPNREWRITQVNYTLDLLKRNLGDDPTSWPHRRVPMS